MGAVSGHRSWAIQAWRFDAMKGESWLGRLCVRNKGHGASRAMVDSEASACAGLKHARAFDS